MIFTETPIAGAYLIDLEKRGDDRGFFARAFCQNEFGDHALETQFVQINNSLTGARGTLRGLHYQLAPAQEVKVMRCVAGALWDVILDIRPDSPSFGRWFGAELTAENRRMMYAPRGTAHGFVTLVDNTETFYLVSAFYAPELERGVRWNDPRFAIEWPVTPIVMSDKDRDRADFDPAINFK
jgi:dTDP-4-dehydrorhamnose 3,5-epimerase